MAEVANEPNEIISRKKHFLLIRTCVYLVLSDGRSISRFLLKPPDFFASVSRFSVFWGWQVWNKINSYQQDYSWLKEKSYNEREWKEKDEVTWNL